MLVFPRILKASARGLILKVLRDRICLFHCKAVDGLRKMPLCSISNREAIRLHPPLQLDKEEAAFRVGEITGWDYFRHLND